ASDTVMHASPATLTVCAYTRRAKGAGSPNLGSVLIASFTIPGRPLRECRAVGASAPSAPRATARTEAHAGNKDLQQKPRQRKTRGERRTAAPENRGTTAGYSWLMAGTDVALGVEADPRVTVAVGVRYLNRELSFLDFVERVLALAEDPEVPPLE